MACDDKECGTCECTKVPAVSTTVTTTTTPFLFPATAAPVGWRCPECNCIYSPLTPECVRCNSLKFVTYLTGTGSGHTAGP